MENKPAVCAYCTKSLNGLPQYHRNHRIFCDVDHATLFDYSDFNPIPNPPCQSKESFVKNDPQWDGFIHWSSKDGCENGGGG